MKLDWRLSHEQVTEDCSEEEKNPTYRESVRCKIFLGFTSNLISSGVRDIIRYLVQHHMVSNHNFTIMNIYIYIYIDMCVCVYIYVYQSGSLRVKCQVLNETKKNALDYRHVYKLLKEFVLDPCSLHEIQAH